MTRTSWACDTSVAIAAIDPTHDAHEACRAAVMKSRPALAGHAAYESHAVLTRLPLPLRLTAVQAAGVLARAFPEVCWLTAEQSDELRDRLGARGIVGGAVYDALVGSASAASGRILLTRDRRARTTYEILEVDYRLVG